MRSPPGRPGRPLSRPHVCVYTAALCACVCVKVHRSPRTPPLAPATPPPTPCFMRHPTAFVGVAACFVCVACLFFFGIERLRRPAVTFFFCYSFIPCQLEGGRSRPPAVVASRPRASPATVHTPRRQTDRLLSVRGRDSPPSRQRSPPRSLHDRARLPNQTRPAEPCSAAPHLAFTASRCAGCQS